MSKSALYAGERFRRAIKAFLLGRAAQSVANFLIILWMVRLLSPADYGAYMALWGMVEMLAPLSSLGLLEATRRFLPDLASRGNSASLRAFVRWIALARLGFLIFWTALIAVIWRDASAWLGFDEDQTRQGWVGISLVITVLGFRYACEMLEGLLEQRWSQTVRALFPIGRLLGIGGLVYADAVSLAHVLWVDAVVSLACLVLAEIFLLRRVRSLHPGGDYAVGTRQVAVFAWHMAGVNLLQATAAVGAMRLLVARLLGLEAAGLYAFLQQLVATLSHFMPAQLLANVIRPMLISRQAVGGTADVARGLALMWKSNVLIVLAVVAALAVGGDALVDAASGGRFADAGLVLLVMLVGLGASSQNQVINMAMQIHDQTRALRIQSLLFLLVPLAAWSGSAVGLTGAVAGMVVAQWVRNLFARWWMTRHGIQITYDLSGAARFAAAALVAAAAGWGTGDYLGSWYGLAVCALLLLVGARLAKPLAADEGDLLDRALKGKARYLAAFVSRA